MQTINLLTRTGSSFPLNISQNNVIRSGNTHKLTLELKFTGREYLILTSELKENRGRGGHSRFISKPTDYNYVDENTSPSTAPSASTASTVSADEHLAKLKRRLGEPLFPNPYNSNLSLHQLAVAPPMPPKFRRIDAWTQTQNDSSSVAIQTPAYFIKPVCSIEPKTRQHSERYTDQDIVKALEIRTMCRKSGYDLIRSYAIADLPSNATIARRIQHIKAHTGLQGEALDLIRALPKCKKYPDVALIMDEMSIEPRVEYSPHIKSLIGMPTLAPITKSLIASNLLLFQISGILANYKFDVGWHLTANTINKDDLNKFFKEIVKELNNVGIHVRCVTSDMGRNNMELWKLHEVYASRIAHRAPDPTTLHEPVPLDLHVNFKYYIHLEQIKHPVYFVADSTHLFKSMRNMLLNHDFRFPAWAVRKWDIQGGDLVKWEYIAQLYDLQKKDVIQMAYKLTTSHINPSNKEKMRVSFARQVFSSETAAAIRVMVAGDLMSRNAHPTAKFLELVEKWHKLINNRRPILAMWKSRPDDNAKTLEFFMDFSLLITQG